MSDAQPSSAVLVQQIKFDELIEAVTTAVVDRITPLLSQQEEGPRLVSREEMARRLDCSLGTLGNLKKSGKIPWVAGVDSRPRFNPEAVIAAIEKGGADV